MKPDDKNIQNPAQPAEAPDIDLKRWEGGSQPHETKSFEGEAAASGAARKLDAPHAKPATTPLEDHEKPDQLAHKADQSEDRQEALIDEGLEETFPASDPVSVKRIT